MNVLTHSVEQQSEVCANVAMDDRLERAAQFLESGLVAPAAELFEEIVAEGPQPLARHGLARCAYLRGDMHEALGHLQLLQVEGPTAEVFNDLGVVYFELGLVEHADTILRKAAGLDPSDPVAWRNLLDVAVARGDRDACRECCEELIALGAADAEIEELLEEL